MASQFGDKLKISVFGQSHGSAIGVVIDGLPAGESVDVDVLAGFMERRRPGRDALSTQRREADAPVFLSGLENGRTVGSPLCAIIENTDTRSGDYAAFADTPRPGHADYTAFVKWQGQADMRGGGHFSGRLTAPLCIAGGIALQILARRGIFTGAHLLELAGIKDASFPLLPNEELFSSLAAKSFPVIDDDRGEMMKSAIAQAKAEKDSVGGIIQCAVIGFPAGLGEPMFDGIESRLAAAVFGIPAVKGIEFGRGFESARLRGSQNNDPFEIAQSGGVTLSSNNCGGILGGISCGMPVTFNAAIKPTPSIALKQRTVSLSTMENTDMEIKGRHDPCIAQRAVPVLEAVTAAVILDIILGEGKLI